MSRIYVLQAHRLAIAAARMKADVNYLGTADKETINTLVQNHVFLRDVWENGEITFRRLQRLYHQLFPGDYLVVEASLGEELLTKALAYAEEAKAKVLLLIRKGESVSPGIYRLADLIVNQGGCIPDAALEGESPRKHPEVLELDPHENVEAAMGAAAQCCMNGLGLRQAEAYVRRAAGFSELPWYDEVAYD